MAVTPLRRLVRTTCVVAALAAGPFLSTAGAASVVTVPGNYPTIQAAISGVPDGTTIKVQAGTYFEALSLSNTARSFTVQAVGGAVIVDASGKQAPVLNVNSASGNVVFEGLTFRNGVLPVNGQGGGFVIQYSSPSFFNCIFESNSAFNGGGGYLNASNATFTGCTIQNNNATHWGGGVYIVLGSKPVFTNCRITGNNSGAGTGTFDGAGGGVNALDASPTFIGSYVHGNTSKFAAGGIYQMGTYGSPYGPSKLVVVDTEVSANVSTQFNPSSNPAEGGGIHVEQNASATLTRVHVLGNQAGTGGGLNAYLGRYDIVDSVIDGNQANGGFGGGIASTSNYASASKPGSIINLTGTLVRNNGAGSAAAGGIAVLGDNFSNIRSSLTLTGSVVDNNYSLLQGGGILVSRADLTVTNSLIIRNTVSGGSAFGGGINASPRATVTINGSTIAHNTAAGSGGDGGGIFIDQGTGIYVSGSNIYDNTASSRGGGVSSGDGTQSGSISNSIIADNTSTAVPGQINEDFSSSVLYQNNTITPVQFSQWGGGGAPTYPRATGTNSNVPRFEQFLAVPSAGTSTTLAWSVARASSVTIVGVGTWNSPNNSPTGTVDVTPASSTTYNLTATATSPNGGNYGSVPAGFTLVQPPPPPPPPTPRHILDGDFDGDGKADLTVFRPTTGTWYVRGSLVGSYSSVWGGGSDIPVTGDYDGDGKTDIAVFRPSNGTWYIRYSGTPTSASLAWGGAGDIPVPGDYDGDGITDIAVFRPSNGTWYIRYSATLTTTALAWGGGSDIPVAADFDGDGKVDLAVFRPSNGTWYIRYSATMTTTALIWGGGSDIPVAADYDGDGVADIAVFRPSNGTWYIRNSATPTSTTLAWGGGSDIPVPGDYDGDGKTDIAVFRPSNGTWYIKYSGTPTSAALAWGGGSDSPILKRP